MPILTSPGQGDDESRAEQLFQELGGEGDQYALVSHECVLLAASPAFRNVLGLPGDASVRGLALRPLRARLAADAVAEALDEALAERLPTCRFGFSHLGGDWISARAWPVDEGAFLCVAVATPAPSALWTPSSGRLMPSGVGSRAGALTLGALDQLPAMNLLTPAARSTEPGSGGRGALQGALELAVRALRPFTLAMLDIERLHEHDELVGQDTGARISRRVGQVIHAALEGSGELFRMGPDRWAMVLASHGPEARLMLIRVVERLADSARTGFTGLPLCATVGFAEFPEHATRIDTLLARTDLARLEAHVGRGTRVRRYSRRLEDHRVRSNMLAGSLRSALLENEFFLCYQPQVERVSLRVSGLEALLRWRHPILGLAMPDEFLGVAAQSGLMPEIDHWVVTRVLQDICRMTAAGFNGKVAINLSAETLGSPPAVAALLDLLQARPEIIPHIEFEVTEAVAMRDLQASQQIIQSLRNHGLSVALDDFGTGYSSFEYLLAFPVDVAKIDRAFIRDVATDPRAARLVRGMIQLLHSLGLSVVAEGVEFERHREVLHGMGCDTLQGYFVSAPVELDEALRLIDVQGVDTAARRLGSALP